MLDDTKSDGRIYAASTHQGPPGAHPSRYERDDTARLAVLRSYGILDTDPEPAFDRIVELAQVLFGTPMALVSFIDGSRQWFKARAGLDVSETPRDVAFCDHVIRTSEVMVVPDALEDARFADNPLVTGEPHIRFYAGAPMITPEGARLGTVCIISPEPRAALALQDQHRLAALAGIAANELELRRKTAHAEVLIEEIQHRVNTTLHFVTRILEVQAARLDDPGTRRHLLEAVDRIAGVEVVQRHLRHGGAVFEADTRDYLLSLALSLQETLLDAADERAVRVFCDDDLAMSPDGMATLGMVVVELVTNALKHGRGPIEIRASAATDDEVLLSVSDEGDGMTADQLKRSSQSHVGLRLVSMLAMPGTLHADPAHPARITARIACRHRTSCEIR